MKKILLFLLLLSGLLTPHSRAQVLYTSPQTVPVTLASATACTGLNQTFATGIAPSFFNLGQTQHNVIATPAAGITQLSVQIYGVDNAGNQIPISDVGFASASIAAIVSASGYYTNIRVIVVCNVGGTFNLTYQGASSTPYINAAATQETQVTKLLGTALNSGTGITLNAGTTPFSNSSGVLWYSTTAAAGGAPTVTVSCSGGTPLLSFTATFSPVSAALTTQSFPLPASPCWFIAVVYTANGASGVGNLSIGITYNAPGLITYAADPCQSPLNNKNSAVITAAAASTTQIVALANGQTISPCGFSVTASGVGTLQWVTGTGANCATGTTNLSGTYTTSVAGPIVFGPGSTVFKVPPSQAICVTMTGAAITAAGVLTYVQQ